MKEQLRKHLLYTWIRHGSALHPTENICGPGFAPWTNSPTNTRSLRKINATLDDDKSCDCAEAYRSNATANVLQSKLKEIKLNICVWPFYLARQWISSCSHTETNSNQKTKFLKLVDSKPVTETSLLVGKVNMPQTKKTNSGFSFYQQ